MSKDQKKTINLSVETVEKIKQVLEWACSTIIFWKLDKTWPTNLIYDELSFISDEIQLKVSSSHIIDK